MTLTPIWPWPRRNDDRQSKVKIPKFTEIRKIITSEHFVENNYLFIIQQSENGQTKRLLDPSRGMPNDLDPVKGRIIL